MKDPSHRFLASRLLVHNQFMGFGNLLETIVHHLLIGGMIGFDHQDEFFSHGVCSNVYDYTLDKTYGEF